MPAREGEAQVAVTLGKRRHSFSVTNRDRHTSDAGNGSSTLDADDPAQNALRGDGQHQHTTCAIHEPHRTQRQPARMPEDHFLERAFRIRRVIADEAKHLRAQPSYRTRRDLDDHRLVAVKTHLRMDRSVAQTESGDCRADGISDCGLRSSVEG